MGSRRSWSDAAASQQLSRGGAPLLSGRIGNGLTNSIEYNQQRHSEASYDPAARKLFRQSFFKRQRADKTFGLLLRRISLNLIEPWFSSDNHVGGIHPGDMWFEKIREKMNSSSAIIAVITKNSLSSKWVFFESGFGAAIADAKLILVTHGIDTLADIPEPLSKWQAFRIDKAESLREFCEKLLNMYDISFDGGLFRNHSKTFLKATQTSKLIDSPEAVANSDSKLLEHFDRRFFELTSQLKVRSEYINYAVIIESSFDKERYVTEISEGHSVQDVLDDVWGLLEEHVAPYTYLQDWVLVHKRTNLRLVIREIAHAVPATAIFAPGSQWIAQELTSPYKPSDSVPEIRAGKKLTD